MTHAPPDANPDPGLSPKQKALIAVGASIAAGCRPCLERTVELARRAGACERSIRLAIETALEARDRHVATLAACAERLQGEIPDVDQDFRRERAWLMELVTCGSALVLRDAEAVAESLAEASRAGSSERLIASALAIARSVAETATSAAEAAVGRRISSVAADPVPCCSPDRRTVRSDGEGPCDCGGAELGRGGARGEPCR